MKKFIYKVEGFKFEDSTAFGTAWEQAKAKATELHCPIFREAIRRNGAVRQEVYYSGGCFNSVEFMREDNVKVF